MKLIITYIVENFISISRIQDHNILIKPISHIFNNLKLAFYSQIQNPNRTRNLPLMQRITITAQNTNYVTPVDEQPQTKKKAQSHRKPTI